VRRVKGGKKSAKKGKIEIKERGMIDLVINYTDFLRPPMNKILRANELGKRRLKTKGCKAMGGDPNFGLRGRVKRNRPGTEQPGDTQEHQEKERC